MDNKDIPDTSNASRTEMEKILYDRLETMRRASDAKDETNNTHR